MMTNIQHIISKISMKFKHYIIPVITISCFFSINHPASFAATKKHHVLSQNSSNTLNNNEDLSSSNKSIDDENKIIAIINGQLLTQRDVNNREKLF